MKIKVSAKTGTKCPVEGKPHQYIDDKTPVAVDSTVYYRRLIADGSLTIVQQLSRAVAQQPKAEQASPPVEQEGKKLKKGGDK